ncbi:MAG: S4 domain-containing protein [Opitutaceae bacterium]|nr:S4 domain-containing protein [Opitutaceae bacterium]
MESSDAVADARLDKWLWTVRVFKTRAEAAEACRLGRVTADGRPAKAAHTVRPGQRIEVRQGLVTRQLVVQGAPRGRQAAAKIGEFVRDETPAEELAAAREQRVQNILAGGGERPTKRDRRAREALWSRADQA